MELSCYIVRLIPLIPQAPIDARSRSDVSRTSNISISAYLRTATAVHSQEDMGNDLLMARAHITPALDGHVRSFVTLTSLLPDALC